MTEQQRIALAEGIGTLILVVGGPGTAVLATGAFSIVSNHAFQVTVRNPTMPGSYASRVAIMSARSRSRRIS